MDFGIVFPAGLDTHEDAAIGKLISHGQSRPDAIQRLVRAIDFFVIEGISTNLPLLAEIVADEAFLRGELSTGFMDQLLARRRDRLAGAGTSPSV